MPTDSNIPAAIDITGDHARTLSVACEGDILRIRFRPVGGIVRLDGVIDARDFDWQRLMLPMRDFGNRGQVVGPWDFDLTSHNEPLVPAWWVKLEDRSLGLLVAMRPSEAHRQRKQFEFRGCIDTSALPATRDAVLTLGGYRGPQPPLLELRLSRAVEQDPASLPAPVELPDAGLAEAQASRQDWRAWWRQAQRPAYAAVHQRVIAEAKAAAGRRLDPELLPVLAMAARAGDDHHALVHALEIVAHCLAIPAWGNPHEDGYGHNEDMGAAAFLEPLSFVYHWLAEALDAQGLRMKLRDRLAMQMRIFYERLLLTEGYWGGSLLQDHGMRAASRFGVAACNLCGVLDDAPAWFRFAIQRMDRVIEALPRDGSIPMHNYMKIHLYMDDMVTWRAALRHMTGRDLFDAPIFCEMIRFVSNRLHLPTAAVMVAGARGDRKDFYAGWGFLNAIAEHHRDGRAAHLTTVLLDRYRTGKPIPTRPLATWPWALAHANDVDPAPHQPETFDARRDLGVVNYRPLGRDVNVSLRCMPIVAHATWAHTLTGCDRIRDAMLEGHFTVSIAGETLLLTAEGGYRMATALGCTLLIDEQGGWGGQGYPMGEPGAAPRAHHIETARHNPASGEAFVRMRLDPAYPRELGLLRYHREFILRPGGLIMRDSLLARSEHHYAWHFHTYARRIIRRLSDQAWELRDGDAALQLTGVGKSRELRSEQKPAEVVWAYANENDSEPFTRIRYETKSPGQWLLAQFEVRW